MLMQKTKAVLFTRKKQPPSSPDSKRDNIVKPTQPPMQEIQKFLDIKNHQAKVKQQINAHKFVPVSQKSALTEEKEEYYRGRIRQLEAEVRDYQGYMTEYEALLHKNKKMEEQMAFILQQLQNRANQSSQEAGHSLSTPQPSPKNGPSFRTLESSAQMGQNSPKYTVISAKPIAIDDDTNKRDQQLQYLHEYIRKVQNSMKQMVAHNQELEASIRKGIKKDLNEMQQRLMNYIFGLEERVSDTTFRNHDLMKKSEISQQAQGYRANETGRSRKSDNWGPSDMFRPADTQGKNGLGASGNKDSVISIMNLEVSESSEQRTTKKEPSLPKITVNKCQKCLEHIKTIEYLNNKCTILEQQIGKSKWALEGKRTISMLGPQKQNEFQTQLMESSNRQSGKQYMLSQIMEQQQSKQQSEVIKRSGRKAQSSLLQSNINILIDSSGESSFAIHGASQAPFGELIRSSSSGSQKAGSMRHQPEQKEVWGFLRLEKVKEQLVSVMQELQQIVHECEYQPGSSLVQELSGKLRQQAEYISELEDELSRLRMEISERKTSREKLERFMKLQVREEEEAQSPYFKPLSEPVSCIDHSATKTRINHILASIKNLSNQPGQSTELPHSSTI